MTQTILSAINIGTRQIKPIQLGCAAFDCSILLHEFSRHRLNSKHFVVRIAQKQLPHRRFFF